MTKQITKVSSLENVNGQAVVVKSRSINQVELTSECWSIQFEGESYCKNSCQFYGTKNCGGKKILLTGQNAKGYSVPLGN